MKAVVCSFFIVCIIFAGTVEAADDWTQQYPVSKPSARVFHAMAYAGDDQVLLFGGYADAADNDETWVYDLSDNTWTQKFPDPHPSARRQHSIAYIGEDKVVLFGGDNGADETWVYDLGDDTWAEQFPNPHPSARDAHAMAYIGGDQVLLFGGLSTNFSDETWVYDLSESTWTQKNPSSKPIARRTHAMAYIGGDHVLMFGGDEGSYVFRNDTWVYDLSANTWTEQSPAAKPSIRWGPEMACMGEDQVLLFGGADGGYHDDTWIYDLSDGNWTLDANTTQPSPRREFGIAETSMDGSNYPVLFGGEDASGNNDETWTFGGGDYPVSVEITPLPSAVPREYRLSQNYPNPFNPATEITYAIPEDVQVTLKVYNVLGAEVATLVDAQQKASFYMVRWDAGNLASGVYFCRLQAGDFNKTIKMILLK